MAQANSSISNLLPGIVTDQPEVFEYEPALSDDTGVNDLDLMNEANDDAIALIEVPIKQAFSYFAERENEIAKFYVQRHGEYKIAGERPDDETDIEKYHRLASEVNELLNKFQSQKSATEGISNLTLTNTALTNNLEILSKQLKALEFAAEDGSLNPTVSGFMNIKSKLEKLTEKAAGKDDDTQTASVLPTGSDEVAKSIKTSALERRLNFLETLIGGADDKVHNLFKSTECDNLTEAAETLGSWSSLFKSDNLQRVSRELDYLNQRLIEIESKVTNADEQNQLDANSKAKLDQLYNLVTATDKHRAMVPTIIHRLSAMEELQQKATRVSKTVNHLEQVQSQIVESLQSNKVELSSLREMFAKNINLIKDYSKDIDSRINALRERDE